MTRLQRDFLGPFVECNGAVNRPPAPTTLDLTGKLAAKHIIYTPTVRVRDEVGGEEVWHWCGEARAYHEARATLSEQDFRRFAAMACGPEFSRNGAARALYPVMAQLYPSGIDYRDSTYLAHSALEKQLGKTATDRKTAAYFASRGAQQPPPSASPPVRLKTVNPADLLAHIAAAPGPAPAPAHRRRPKA